MQASFYQKLVTSGLSIDDVAKRFGLPSGRIREALHAHNLYQMACRLNLGDEVTENVRNPRKFSLTTLSRIFETPIGRSSLGVELSEDGKIIGKIREDEFKKAFAKIVRDVSSGNVDSRKLNSPAEIKRYLDQFSAADKPDLDKAGAFDSDTFLKTSPQTSASYSKPAKSKRSSARISKGLIPRSFTSSITNRRVQVLLAELKSLGVKKFPNSVALALRCFLELSLHCFLDAKGEIKRMEAEEKTAIKAKNATRSPGKSPLTLPQQWSPTLQQMINRVIEPKHNLMTDAQVVKAMKKTIKDEQELFGLNLYAHNPSYNPSETRLRNSWRNFEDFLRLLHS
jgi:hypothetical protein